MRNRNYERTGSGASNRKILWRETSILCHIPTNHLKDCQKSFRWLKIDEFKRLYLYENGQIHFHLRLLLGKTAVNAIFGTLSWLQSRRTTATTTTNFKVRNWRRRAPFYLKVLLSLSLWRNNAPSFWQKWWPMSYMLTDLFSGNHYSRLDYMIKK